MLLGTGLAAGLVRDRDLGFVINGCVELSACSHVGALTGAVKGLGH